MTMARGTLMAATLLLLPWPALPGQCSTGIGGSLTVSTSTTIDTDAGTITPPGGISPGYVGGEFHFTDITIAAGVTLTVVGSQPLLLLATTDVQLDGTIDAAGADGGYGTCNLPGGAGGIGGCGGGDGGAGGGLAPGSGTQDGLPGLGPGGGLGGTPGAGTGNSTGGGGAGHQAAGAPGVPGGSGGTPGAGGPSYASLPPLLGGSGGGGGSLDDDDSSPAINPIDDGGGGGGGGGGMVQITAQGSLTLGGAAAILCAGGDGGDTGAATPCAGGGGGGSGGAIQLLGTTMPVVAPTATLDVTGGAGGTSTAGATGGQGSDGRVDIGTFACIPPPACTLTAPAGVLAGPVPLTLDASSPSAATVDVLFEYTLDLGVTYSLCTPDATSPLANPETGLATGPASFVWDSRADLVGLASVQTDVSVRATVDDLVSPVPGTCETAAFDVDNTALCYALCGDCDQNGLGPSITDALTAAQISAGLMVPVPLQEACCDVSGSLAVEIIDALLMAQAAAGLVVTLACP